ncbi:type VI secretion system tube protein Hcp [Luteolibacter flavescens]|uniref:Type VI secretion system tube protein Hcp n=1 Tax=Luteolibacter flavescens TaxID=1859460 RepID=A0ABT3FSQ3_9BACT|nr:type VI secretion system tube protein Hcp [Luteolibacter flavescens]MCW1886590.1 type VI secretion system tube protein Hcp [Luteolibacter flavescens]
MKSLPFLPVIAITSLVLTLSQAQADIFIRFQGPGQGVPAYVGDSRNATFKGTDGWFELQSFSFGTENTVNFATGGGSAGKPAALPVKLAKTPNAASAAIMTACVTGGHWDTAEIVYTRPFNNKSEIYLKVELKIAIPTKIGLSIEDEPSEDVVLIYAAQRISFFSQNPTSGAPVAAGVSTWSFTRNAPTFAS